MSGPAVYRAITEVTAELARSGVAKTRLNSDDDYAYRGIDDLLVALAPALAKAKLCVLPHALSRDVCEPAGHDAFCRVTVRMAYDIVSTRDGSSHRIEVFGEAWDSSDKATSKAITSAFKAALIQAFCIPVRGSADPDASSPRVVSPALPAPAVTDWKAWVEDFLTVAESCVSVDALARLQGSQAFTLRELSLAEPGLYAETGVRLRALRQALEPVSQKEAA